MTAVRPFHYLATWVALLLLTALSFGLSYVALGWAEMPVAMLIATIKATLVAFFFMHLVEAPFAYRFSLLVAVLMVILLVGLSVADVDTRAPLPVTQPLHGR